MHSGCCGTHKRQCMSVYVIQIMFICDEYCSRMICPLHNVCLIPRVLVLIQDVLLLIRLTNWPTDRLLNPACAHAAQGNKVIYSSLRLTSTVSCTDSGSMWPRLDSSVDVLPSPELSCVYMYILQQAISFDQLPNTDLLIHNDEALLNEGPQN